jgi:prepilin signal peptidase PulO-like enzyme (type II secretory pathway)
MPLRLLGLFLIGACLGAVVNLGIYRLAYLRRRISPWSRTRGRMPPRGLLDRVPIIGWWNLRREAKIHGRGFWIRPMLLELTFGIGIAALYWLEIGELIVNRAPAFPGIWPNGAAAMTLVHFQFAIHVVLLVLLAMATFIDIDEQTIPDAITIPGTIIGLSIAALCSAPVLPMLQIGGQPPAPADLTGPLRFDYPIEAADFLASVWSLVIGLVVYLGWCFALLPRRWRTGVGIIKAWRVMWRRIAARPEKKWTLPIAAVGSAGIVTSWLQGGHGWRGLFSALVGLAVGGGIIWLIRLIGGAVLKREAMGFGDVTLMAMIGAFVGWQPVLIVFFMAPFVGAVVGLLQWIMIGENIIPFGPFLCLGALTTLVFWAGVWDYASELFAIQWLVPSAIAICLPLLGAMLYGWQRLRDRISGV